MLPMSARQSIPALSLVSSNLLQDSVDIHRVHSDHGVYMLAKIFMRDDMLETWKHGHVPSHNYFSSLCLRTVLLCVVQDQFQAQSTPRMAFGQEGEDDEDITTSSHTSQVEEEVQHGRPIHLFRGGSQVQLKFESSSGSRTSLP